MYRNNNRKTFGNKRNLGRGRGFSKIRNQNSLQYTRRRNMLMRNSMISNRISRNMGYPRLGVRVFGQQQDLAFNVKRKQKKGIMQTLTAPISESNTIKTFVTFNNDILTLCQPINPIFFADNVAIIPTHPMFYQGRIPGIAKNYSNYQVINAKLNYVPLIGTTSTGQVAMCSTRHSTPISYDTTLQFGNITNVSSQISSVWMCTNYKASDLDTEIKNMVPMNRNDLSNVFYVAGSGLAADLNVTCNLFVELSYKFTKPAPLIELVEWPNLMTYIISVAGIRSDYANNMSRFNIVVTSTALNIDVGELLVTPGFAVAGTDYLANVTHNNCPVNYASASDQGTITCFMFSCS